MSENEHVVVGEATEISDESIQDFISSNEPTFHPILEVWKAVLSPARHEVIEKVSPREATRIVSAYVGLAFGDMVEFRRRFYEKIFQLLDILEMEIDSDDECLNARTPEEDVEQNSHHYKNLLMLWQQSLLQWELDWDTTDPYAGAEIAAMSEVHKMFFGETGLVAYLDNIKFEFTEADQAELAAVLEEQQEGR